jgi:hypothetical protein
MSQPFRRYPRGRLNADDEGEIQMAVTVQDDVVVIAFPKRLSWVGLPAELAEELAQTLLTRATEARKNRQ